MGPPWGLQHMFPPHPVPGWRWTSCSFGYWAVICGWSDRSSWARWTCGTAGTRRHPLPPGRAQRAGQTARAGCESQVELPASVTQRATTTRRQPQTTTGSTDASPVHGPQPCYSPHVPENPARCARSSCAPGAVSPRKNSVQATGTFPDARKNSPRCPLPSARATQGGGRSDSITDVAAAGPSSPLSRDMAKCPQVGETQGRVMGWGAPTSQDTPTTASAAQGYASRQTGICPACIVRSTPSSSQPWAPGPTGHPGSALHSPYSQWLSPCWLSAAPPAPRGQRPCSSPQTHCTGTPPGGR